MSAASGGPPSLCAPVSSGVWRPLRPTALLTAHAPTDTLGCSPPIVLLFPPSLPPPSPPPPSLSLPLPPPSPLPRRRVPAKGGVLHAEGGMPDAEGGEPTDLREAAAAASPEDEVSPGGQRSVAGPLIRTPLVPLAGREIRLDQRQEP